MRKYIYHEKNCKQFVIIVSKIYDDLKNYTVEHSQIITDELILWQ